MGMIGGASPGASGDPSLWQILGRMVTHGEAPDDASMAIRQRNYQMNMLQLMPQIIGALPADQRAAAIASGPAFWENYDKRFAPQGVKGGDSVQYDGPQGSMTTAPLVGFDDKSGKGYAVAGDATTTAPSPSLGGDYSLVDRAEISGRTGLDGGGVSAPQVVPMGSNLFAAPAPSVRQGAAASAVFGDPTVPAGVGTAPGVPQRPAAAGDVGAMIAAEAKRQGVDPQLALGVWRAEGQGGAGARSPKGAIGPMQLMPGTAAELGVDPTDLGQNIAGGVRYLKQQLTTFKDPHLAVAAYNAGPGAVRAHGGVPAFPETQAYVQRAFAPPESGGGVPQRGAPAAASGGATLLAQGGTKRLLSPQEAAKAGFAPGTVVEQAPDGTTSVAQAPQYDANWAKGQKELFVGQEPVKQNAAAQAAYTALVANAGHLTGPAAYSILDTFARTINPGAVARPMTIEAIQDQLGVPARTRGAWQNLQGQGKLSPHVEQSIIDAVTPFAQAHWDAAKQLYDSYASVGAKHGFAAEETTQPIGARPEHALVTQVGALTPTLARAQQAQLIAQARQAIAQGKDRGAVIGRLQALGLPTKGF